MSEIQPTNDPAREGLDLLLGDMAGHQARHAPQVTPDANCRLAADLFTRIDREQADAAPLPPSNAPAAPETTEHKQVGGKAYRVDVAPDVPMMREADEAEAWFLRHAMPRVELLATKLDTGPLGQASWATRLKAVMATKMRAQGLRMACLFDAARILDRRFHADFVALLEESSAAFGDWKKDPEKRLIFT